MKIKISQVPHALWDEHWLLVAHWLTGLAWLGVFRMSLAILFSICIYRASSQLSFSDGTKYSGAMAPERCTLLLDRMNG
jgi:hypothetical protein